MDETAIVADPLRDCGYEGDNVVLGRPFDLFDPLNVESGLFLDGLQRLTGYLPQIGKDLADKDLDSEPRPEAILRAPDPGHLISRISRTHAPSSQKNMNDS